MEKLLPVVLPRVASVADKSNVSCSDSVEQVIGSKSNFGQRAIRSCDEAQHDLIFSPATAALIAQGRAHIHVRDSEAVRYSAKADYMCREFFARVVAMREGGSHDSKACHETSRADMKRALRGWPFFNLCRKLGFGIEGQEHIGQFRRGDACSACEKGKTEGACILR